MSQWMTVSNAVWATLESMLIILAPAYLLFRKLNKIESRIDKIESQFHRNGGSSLRDQNDRIERDLARLTGRFDQHIDEQL